MIIYMKVSAQCSVEIRVLTLFSLKMPLSVAGVHPHIAILNISLCISVSVKLVEIVGELGLT